VKKKSNGRTAISRASGRERAGKAGDPAPAKGTGKAAPGGRAMTTRGATRGSQSTESGNGAGVKGVPAPDAATVTSSEVRIAAPKGRPMLTWVGKRPLRHVKAFPAQQSEAFESGSGAGEHTRWEGWPAQYPQGGLLFHGDNKEVLAHLLANGLRGKVKLVYIDPPFDSGADYVRKVSLRGAKSASTMDGESYSLGEQIQYTDIWANDNYLQFMYERLLLLKELLALDSRIFVHCDPKRNYQLRMLLDEIFGAESFENEIVWWYWNKMQGNVGRFASNHDTILVYRRGSPAFKKIVEEREGTVRQLKRVWDPRSGSLVNAKDESGNVIYIERDEKTLDDIWRIPMLQPADKTENLRFPTQKPEDLLSIVVESSTAPGDIVLDCFVGSGTTAAVAQKLGRRWIGCDINKGAIQTTAKRLQGIIQTQHDAPGDLGVDDNPPAPAQLSFTTWRVNDYDLQVQHNEAVNLAAEFLGLARTRVDGYFDGTLGRSLAKIIPFGRPLTPIDLEELRRELEARPEEDRPVTIVCLGMEMAAQTWVDEWNALRRGADAVNKIRIVELRTDPKYGGFLKHEPAQARVRVLRHDGRVEVEIVDFVSQSIVQRLNQQEGVLAPRIDDWRAMVDCVMIDPAFDGNVFNVALTDVPERKTDFVRGRYELAAPPGPTTVAVKIIDMLGEEVVQTEEV
jgi:DNA modification methylase